MARYVFTNTSDWLFPTNPVTLANTKETSDINTQIYRMIVTHNHTTKIRRTCFDQCVKDFSSKFSSAESSCLNSCIRKGDEMLSDISFDLRSV
jgi:hypothetical protein